MKAGSELYYYLHTVSYTHLELVKPFMYDAAGSKSEDVHFETVRLENRTQVTVCLLYTSLSSVIRNHRFI